MSEPTNAGVCPKCQSAAAQVNGAWEECLRKELQRENAALREQVAKLRAFVHALHAKNVAAWERVKELEQELLNEHLTRT